MKKEEENRGKLMSAYISSAYFMATEIYKEQLRQESTNIFEIENLANKMSSYINEYSETYRSGFRNNLSYNKVVEECDKVYIERLINLGIEGDFIPNEELNTRLSKNTLKLIELTRNLLS